jgi:hypothetical protein
MKIASREPARRFFLLPRGLSAFWLAPDLQGLDRELKFSIQMVTK